MTLKHLLILVLFLSGLSSCHKVTMVVEGLPDNTPENGQIFLAGNFNFWDPGDRNFQLQPYGEGKYLVDLPVGWGTVAYKFTRGDWTTVETDPCGHEINNHLLDFFERDTIYERIDSWKDLGPTRCPKVLIRLKKLPKETPAGSKVYLAGNFNNWNPADEKYRMKPDSQGHLVLSIGQASEVLEFKFTRGSWNAEEANANGNKIENRRFQPGTTDTLDLTLDGWHDVDPGEIARRVTFLVRVPPTTPANDSLFLVGTFNKWNPHDKNYVMRRVGSNLYAITMNKPKGKMQYKITRGSWYREEVDSYGNLIENHKLRTLNDTVYLNVVRWRDDPSVLSQAPPPIPGHRAEPVPPPVDYGPIPLEPRLFMELEEKLRSNEKKVQAALRDLDAAYATKNAKAIQAAKEKVKALETEIHALEDQIKGKRIVVPYGEPGPDMAMRPGEKHITFVIRNSAREDIDLFIRAELAGNASESLGFAERIGAGVRRRFTVPDGTKLFITEGPPAGDVKPRERFYRRISEKDEGMEIEARDLVWKK